jgi:CDP-glycerol glycerophosphotransferase (TagB/SpsB family)
MILERVWIFGSGKGETYGDNSRALFEYVTKNEPSIRAIWLTKRKDISLHVRKLGGISYHYYSLPGIFYALTARVIVVCNSFLDVSFLAFAFPRRKLIVQLWHGTPLKKLESMHWPKLKGLAMNTFLGYLGRDCDMVFSATDLNEELASAAAIITDYSSVYFDFLLLDRPIIFAAFDLETYKRKRNFYYDYDSVTPGPKARDWDETITQLELILNGEDDWRNERHRINERFNLYKNADSSRRVFFEIRKKLYET